jgi:vitamin B12 transporter
MNAHATCGDARRLIQKTSMKNHLQTVLPPSSARPNRRILTLTISALCVTPLMSAAQTAALPPAQSIESISVTATRTPIADNETLAQIATITRREIEEGASGTLAELLQRKAGVEIRATGGAGQPVGVFIRGAGAQQTLVLIDGLRVGSSTSGSTAFENIPLDMIERIEVVKGPLSGLYGSDAIGGVVQIFTRGYNQPRLTAEAGAGSNSTLAFNGGFSTTEKDTSFTLNAGYREASPRSATNPRAGSFTYNPDRDPYRNTHFLAKVSQKIWTGEVVSVTAWQSVGRTNYDAGPTDNASSRQTLSGAQLISENNLLDFWKSTLRLGQTSDKVDIRSEFPDTFRTRQNQISWQNRFATPVGAWLAGYERRDERVTSQTAFDKTKRVTDSFFLSVTESIDLQRLSAAVRRDRESQFGSNTTGNISYGVQVQPDQLVYVSYGEAFRAPSFNDLYYPGFSNPLLKPEKSRNAEYGWRVIQKIVRFNLALFENRINDLIAYDAAANKPLNVKRARIRGGEASVDFPYFGINWRASVTGQRPEDADTEKQLRSRAKVFGSVAASKTFGSWDFSTDVTGSGARFDADDESPANKLAGYLLLNASVRYRIDKMWTLELTTQNLTDKKYEQVRGYNTPGRTLFLNVKAVAQ